MVRGRWGVLFPLGVLSLGLGVAGWLAACTLGGREESVLPPIVAGKVTSAHALGSAACEDCHDDAPDFYRQGYHKIAFFDKAFGMGCESCHGVGSVHVEYFEQRDDYEPERRAFDIVGVADMRALTQSERSALCLQCHQDDFPLWPTTEHALYDVSCWDCHGSDLHQPPPDVAEYKPAVLYTKRDDKFCLQCHEEVRMDFRLQYRHRVLEGQIRCAACHNIHGEPRENLVLQEHDFECLTCHPSVRGPWVFEHLAMEEGCAVCHQPHGSVNNKLLITNDNSLCINCHFQEPVGFFGRRPHVQFLRGGALCYDCHFQVHGSNTDQNFNPRRY